MSETNSYDSFGGTNTYGGEDLILRKSNSKHPFEWQHYFWFEIDYVLEYRHGEGYQAFAEYFAGESLALIEPTEPDPAIGRGYVGAKVTYVQWNLTGLCHDFIESRAAADQLAIVSNASKEPFGQKLYLLQQAGFVSHPRIPVSGQGGPGWVLCTARLATAGEREGKRSAKSPRPPIVAESSDIRISRRAGYMRGVGPIPSSADSPLREIELKNAI